MSVILAGDATRPEAQRQLKHTQRRKEDGSKQHEDDEAGEDRGSRFCNPAGEQLQPTEEPIQEKLDGTGALKLTTASALTLTSRTLCGKRSLNGRVGLDTSVSVSHSSASHGMYLP